MISRMISAVRTRSSSVMPAAGSSSRIKFGPAAQHQRKLDPLALAVRELADRLVGEAAEPESLDLRVNGGIGFSSWWRGERPRSRDFAARSVR